MEKLRYANAGKFQDPNTAREVLINASFDIEEDASVFWADRVKGYILLDHILEYVKDPNAYERKIKAAALAGIPALSDECKAYMRVGRR
jgi:hypothetical protein